MFAFVSSLLRRLWHRAEPLTNPHARPIHESRLLARLGRQA